MPAGWLSCLRGRRGRRRRDRRGRGRGRYIPCSLRGRCDLPSVGKRRTLVVVTIVLFLLDAELLHCTAIPNPAL